MLVVVALYWVNGNLGFLTSLIQLSFCVYVENESLWVGAKEVLLILSLLNVKYFSYCVMAYFFVSNTGSQRHVPVVGVAFL